MKKKILLSAVFIFFALTYFHGVAGPTFFAQILRDGNYLFSLVNKQNSLDAYIPADLVELSGVGAPGKYVRIVAYEELRYLLLDAKEAGVPVKVISAYRSYERQDFIHVFWSRRSKDADRFSAEAGHSEHQLGTTVDFGIGYGSVDLKEKFGGTPTGKWLAANAAKYGFAMTYPKDKEAITGYTYEPWHFRFIGASEATKLQESGLTLEEYLATKPQYYRLIRRYDDYKVYSVDPDGTKHWITTEEQFLSMGYDWDDVVIVDDTEFNLYTQGSQI